MNSVLRSYANRLVRMTLLFALTCSAVGLAASPSAEAVEPTSSPSRGSFHNPLNQGPDPFLTFWDGNYLLTTTQGNDIKIWKSATLGGLTTAEPLTVWRDDNPSRNQQIWNPSFYFEHGRWYIYYPASDGVGANHRLYVIESAGIDPLGPYHFKAKLSPPGDDHWAIDPALLRQDGHSYLLWSGSGIYGHNRIYIAPMSNPWTISGPRTYLPAAGGCSNVREAPSLLQHRGTTYLIYSTCDTGTPDYQLWMMTIPRSEDPTVASNWRQVDHAVFTRNDSAGVYGPGSSGFFRSPDHTETWIVYHAKTTSAYSYAGRTTRAQKISWNADGSPDLGKPLGLSTDMPLPSGDPGPTGDAVVDGSAASGNIGSRPLAGPAYHLDR